LGLLLLNIGLIITIVVLQAQYGIVAACLGQIVGTLVQFGFLALLIRKYFSFTFYFNPKEEKMKQALKMSLPVFWSISVAELNAMINRMVASFLFVGSIAALSYAQKLNTIFISFFTSAIATIVYPLYAESAAKGDTKQFNSRINLTMSAYAFFLVPVMAVIYVVTALLLILSNVGSVPWFFKAVFEGAFKPEAVFGGFFGTALLQGVKRGLMSNEAGQGTITMAAASAEAHHPCEQGIISALGVFLDTHVICTMTGFIIVMAHEWAADPAAWKAAGTYAKFLTSVNGLSPEMMQVFIQIMVSVCFCLFAYTCVIGFVSFSEISANRISSSKGFINFIRGLCIFVAAFGIACNIAGYDLSNLWAFSDLGNIIMVYCNVPMLYLGLKYVKKAANHYSRDTEASFDSEKVLGIRTDYWDGKEK
jgi:hypothetical protein